MRKVQNSKRILSNRRDAELPGESFKKQIAKIGCPSSVSGAVLKKKNVVAILRGRLATSSSEDVFFGLQVVPEESKQSASLRHGQKIQRKVRETVMAPTSSDVWWNNEYGQLPRSVSELIQSSSGKTWSSLRSMTLVTDSGHLVWLENTERKKRYLLDDTFALFGFLPVEIAGKAVEDESLKVDERTFSVLTYIFGCNDSKEIYTATILKRSAKNPQQDDGRSSVKSFEAFETGYGEWA